MVLEFVTEIPLAFSHTICILFPPKLWFSSSACVNTWPMLWCLYIEAFTEESCQRDSSLFMSKWAQVDHIQRNWSQEFSFLVHLFDIHAACSQPCPNGILPSAHANEILEIAANLVSSHQHSYFSTVFYFLLPLTDGRYLSFIVNVPPSPVLHFEGDRLPPHELNDPCQLEKILEKLVKHCTKVVILNIPNPSINMELCLCIWIISLEVKGSNKLKHCFAS